jgi:hypothetical protein
VFTFGVPAAPSLCGARLSSQWLGICPGLGTFVSNALSWEISTS